MTKGEIVKVDEKIQVDSLIEKAIEKGADVEVMEKMFNLQREWKKDQAKELFDSAMAQFQGDCPTITKTKEVKSNDGKLLYSYAPIDSIVGQVKNILKECGLSYKFETKINGEVVVTCIIKHIAGHQEISEMTVPKSQSKGIQSSAQAVGGDVTFAKRYAFCNALGIMTGEDDNDAKLVPPIVDVKVLDKLKKCKTHQDIKKFVSRLSEEERKNVLLVKEINDRIEYVKIPTVKEKK